jgi:hypothetical protein
VKLEPAVKLDAESGVERYPLIPTSRSLRSITTFSSSPQTSMPPGRETNLTMIAPRPVSWTCFTTAASTSLVRRK